MFSPLRSDQRSYTVAEQPCPVAADRQSAQPTMTVNGGKELETRMRSDCGRKEEKKKMRRRRREGMRAGGKVAVAA